MKTSVASQMKITNIDLSKLILPVFYKIHEAVKHKNYTYFDLKGGRGSGKSYFVAEELILGMMRDRQDGVISHALALRFVANTLEGSIAEDLQRAIDLLGVNSLWKRQKNPKRFIYLPDSDTPQYIRLEGCDEPSKLKSMTFAKGYCKYVWFEETQEFKKASDLQSILLTCLRSNDRYPFNGFVVFRTFNPKAELNHWLNIDMQYKRKDRLVHHSTYLDVPKGILQQTFYDEAEITKGRNYKEYQNVFLGEVVGTDGLCYPMFDVNKHVVDIKNFEFKPHEKVARIVCGCDGGSVLDATTLNILLLTTANRIVRLPGFYYDPANWGHSPLANVVQVELMEYWLDYWLWYFKVDYCHDIKIVVDSASADLINQFNYSSKYHAVSTGAKDVIIDMRNLQNVYTVPNYFITVNAGYIDPISLPQKTSNGYASSNFRMLGDNDMLIVEELSLIMDEKTNKPVDGNDHMTDGMKYAIKGL